MQWARHDGITDAITQELDSLGVKWQCFLYNEAIPTDANVVLTFAPYGPFLPIAAQLQRRRAGARATLIHWNLESLPDPRIPRFVLERISGLRSCIGRMNKSAPGSLGPIGRLGLSVVDSRMHKFRYVGDYLYSYRRRWLDVLADASGINAQRFSQLGIPTAFVPWGTPRAWYADLHLERDIDVLWMGKRRNRRRGLWLDRLQAELQRLGLRVYMADGVQNPFIYGSTRTEYLNRAKITLNRRTCS